jgi:hypothetical protein
VHFFARPGGLSCPEALGILGIADIYLNDNFEPTTPFFSIKWKKNFKEIPTCHSV